MLNKLGFGYYRMGYDQKSLMENMKNEFDKGHLNTNIVSLAPYCLQDVLESLKLLKTYHCATWLGIAESVFVFSQPVQLIDKWEDNLKAMMDTIEKEGLMDTVVGFYFDEPMLCGIKKDVFRDVTKHLRETYPTMRVFTIFATNLRA